MTRTTKLVISLAGLVLVSSWAFMIYGLVRIDRLMAVRNAVDAATFDRWKMALYHEIEERLRAERELAGQQRATTQKDAADAKRLAEKALTRPQTTVLSVKTPIPVHVVPGAPTPEPTTDTNPKSGGLFDW